MRNISVFVFLFVLIFISSCTEQESTVSKPEAVQVSINAGEATIPEESYFIITVNDATGKAVLTDHLMSAETPLNLPAGHYTISDFNVADDDHVLMAAPKRGSRLAQNVGHALDYEFEVKKGSGAAVTIDVLQAGTRQAGDFGYSSFNLLAGMFNMRTRSVSYFEFSMSGIGLIDVAWGDGVVEQYDLSSSANYMAHSYATAGIYIITVTGAVDQITDFYSFYGSGPVSSINFSNMTALRDVRLGITDGPPGISLVNCTNLETVNMPGINQLGSLLLPTAHHINYIDVSGPNTLNAADINGITNNIYANTVTNSITNGNFLYWDNWLTTAGPIGPPSAASYVKLTDLQNTYGWSVQPIP